MATTVTQRRPRGRSRDPEPLLPRDSGSVASYNSNNTTNNNNNNNNNNKTVSSFPKLFSYRAFQGVKASSKSSPRHQHHSHPTGGAAGGGVYVSLPVKLSLFGGACLVWLCLDPVLHADRSPLFDPSVLTKDHHRPVVKPEVIYPRGVVYDALGEEEETEEAHDKAERTTKERHKRVVVPIIPSARYHKYASVHPLSSQRRQSHIKNSKEYRGLDEYEVEKKDDCQVKYDWQRTYRPNCNSMHEVTDLTRPTAVVPATEDSTTRTAAAAVQVDRYQFLTHGYYRDVLMLLDEHTHQKTVFKPMRYRHDFSYRNFDRMRRDALTMDQLTGAKHILNIYANCGTSGLFEYADGGDIETAIWPKKDSHEDEKGSSKLTQMEKLHIATQAAMGLASLHNMDEEGRASVAHTDIAPGQFIKVNGVYKLNDFNRARFLKYSTSNGTVCPFYVSSNGGKNRSPEEYRYGPETEMVDIYSFGNIMYMLLQGEWPFDDLSETEATEKVAKAVRPTIYADIWNSKDPVNSVLKQAMIMCHAQEPHERKTARQIETYLKDSMRELDPGRLEEWGDAKL